MAAKRSGRSASYAFAPSHALSAPTPKRLVSSAGNTYNSSARVGVGVGVGVGEDGSGRVIKL
jgi:hypothetical protein